MPNDSKQWIVDVTDDNFEREVVERSNQTLCIVDFWAEWCAPCRMLGPVLEELANEYEGKFILIKINTEQAPKTSMDYGIQSIPAVFAFSQGQPIDGFAGVLPKESIKEWIDNQFSANEVNEVLQSVESEPEAAITKLEELVDKYPEEPAIKIGLAKALAASGQSDQAAALIAQLEDRGFLEPEADKIKAQLELQSKQSIDLEAAADNAKAAPDDLQLQLKYAEALFGHEQFEQGFEVCLNIVRRDKKGAGDQARELMIEVFKSLPDDSELTHNYRRQLSMALY